MLIRWTTEYIPHLKVHSAHTGGLEAYDCTSPTTISCEFFTAKGTAAEGT